ncbi:hypothetical protein BU15DRAFT_70532 [Melanogaster broomeanus]|nr:hypothetical protein BU15DRAFT_70532 [Melanogaster broomeanus]
MSNRVGDIKDLDISRAQGLQGLLSSLGHATSDPSSGAKLSPEQLRNLSTKIEEILGDGADQSPMQRNELGQLLNEEGLPIIDISEPTIVPAALLPPSEMERRRRERDRILDLLEEEEQLQQLQQERDAEEERKEAIRKRKELTKAELERLNTAKELQKKMGKALIQNVTEATEKEENSKKEEAVSKHQTTSSAPKKSVAFADAPVAEDEEREKKSSKLQVDWSDISAGRLRSSGHRSLLSPADAAKYPMKMNVVERRPTGALTRPIVQNCADSDDESPLPSEHSSLRMENVAPDEEEEDTMFEQISSSNDESSDEEPMEEEFDWDSAQHHREIALEYYQKRHAIGAETAKAMAAHSHDEDEDDGPQERMSGQSSVKSPLSRFRADRMAATYDKAHAPMSTSIGPSVIPVSHQKSLRHSIRVGKLENGQLVGGESGESGSEDGAANEVLQMLKNAGPEFDPSALTGNVVPPPANAGEPSHSETSLLPPAPAHATKPSRFKSAHAGRTAETNAIQDAPSAYISQPKPTISGVVERRPGQQFLPNKPARRIPTAIKPSDPTPSPHSMIIESPSFPRTQPVTPKEDVRLPSRPQRPPVVVSSMVKESSGQSQSSTASIQAAPKKPMSKFMAERG